MIVNAPLSLPGEGRVNQHFFSGTSADSLSASFAVVYSKWNRGRVGRYRAVAVDPVSIQRWFYPSR